MEKYDAIIQKSWSDSSFKSRLIENPKATFSEMGYDFGKMDVRVFNDTTDTAHYVLLSSEQAALVNLDNDPVIGKVTKRALTDADYKSRLLSDASSAIREVLGVEPPQNIIVHENTSDILNIVLPNDPNGELSDSDLSMVAGGKGLNINCETIGNATTGAGNLMSKVGSYLPGNFGGMFSSLGPILTGGGSMVGKASGFLGFMGM
ncbi:MAG: hypothetical protein HQM11_17685 [SAR324 cluster bacterium]|nr:hypothetical protein [SAR324 cluster bacterium]